ncbi:MAG: BamA/TamA family outer membrane protein [Bacteroidota bacterium]|nr:BamA/TamA family outer membrane protein [Bacteroidota bacterium]
MPNLYLILLIYLAANICIAQQIKAKKPRSVSITPLPVIYYAPETRLGLGAAAAFVFRIFNSDTLSRRSNIQPYLIYTVNKQILSSIGYTLFFKEEKLRTEGEFAYYYFPEFYYGIGNNLPLSNQDTITYSWIRVYNKSLYKITNGIFSGLVYEYVNMFDLKRNTGNTLDKTKPTGFEGSRISGIGPAVTYDTRDNVLNASKGMYLDLTALVYHTYTGSAYDFQKVKIDLRYFTTVWVKHRHVLAFQAYGVFVPGNAPFKHLAQLGGDVITRGYYAGRYRNTYFMAFQAEYRLPIWRFIGIVSFAGAGSTASNMSQFENNTIWPSYGGGLRIRISKKDNINIRLDYGVGNGSDGYYINIAEAF